MSSTVTIQVTEKPDAHSPMNVADIVLLAGELNRFEATAKVKYEIVTQGKTPKWKIGVQFNRTIMRDECGDILDKARKRSGANHLQFNHMPLKHSGFVAFGP